MKPALPQLTTAVEAAAVVVMTVEGMVTAARARMDLVGTFTLALVTAFGGGTLRDILLERRPFFWVSSKEYVFLTLLLCLAFVYSRKAFAVADALDRRSAFVDSLGLALFSLTGVRYALEAGLPPLPGGADGRRHRHLRRRPARHPRPRGPGHLPAGCTLRGGLVPGMPRRPRRGRCSRSRSRSPTPRASRRSSSSAWPPSGSASASPPRTGSGRRTADWFAGPTS